MTSGKNDHPFDPQYDDVDEGVLRPDPPGTKITANKTSRTSRAGRRFVIGVILLAALITVGSGAWALAAPESFADYTEFAPYNEHFVHDIGAFLSGIGAALLASLVWRNGKTVVLVGFLVANTMHAINHWTDLHLGGRDRDPWVFLAVSLLALIALIVHARQLRRQTVSPSTADEPAAHR